MSDAVLLPVYNEEETVGSVLDAVRGYFHGDVLVVDDGSTDGTAEVLSARTDVSVITHPFNMGYGRALSEGLSVARARGCGRVVTMDCDGQHEPAHIHEFLTVLDEGWDIVSGSRYLPDSEELGIVAPGQRQEVNRRVTDEINSVTGWSITDAFCGFKAYRLAALDGIELSEPGYALPLEMWAKAYRAGLHVREMAVARIYCDHNRSFGDGLDDAEHRFGYYMRVWRQALGAEGA
ncbi:MAG: glycosyltransferase family 2 protein [Anaerosomatales bacterium]|nr:glycosyltransferase family 2 protein [Anaerosomatales bacterium]MDT8433576.1 glycosyltransferase family 2 protein [Anaerosomatales bacterium]